MDKEIKSNVLIYARVSGDGSNRLTEEQVEVCMDYCVKNRLPRPAIECVRGSSGRTFKYLVQRIRKSREKINLVVSSLDRITRSRSDLVKLTNLVDKGKLEVHTSKNSEINLCLGLQKVFVEYEHRVLSNKAKQAWKLRKERLAKLKAPASTSAFKKIK